MYHLFIFYCNNGYMNAAQCYVNIPRIFLWLYPSEILNYFGYTTISLLQIIGNIFFMNYRNLTK